jgi:CheY-like chemotaxis protein/AraC-like DNA-binding protein
MDKSTFRVQLEQALANLRDIVRLRVMALAQELAPDIPHDQAGWALSQRLLQLIEDVRPRGESAESWVAQRYRILNLRYVNGLSPDEVSERLAISRRHFYRQLRRALDEFTEFVWVATKGPDNVGPDADGQEESSPSDEFDLLQHESATVLLASPSASLAQVLASVQHILRPLLAKAGIALATDLPATLPNLAISGQILKQFFLGLLSDIWRQDGIEAIVLTASDLADVTQIAVEIHGRQAISPSRAAEWLTDLQQRATTRLAQQEGLAISGGLESTATVCWTLRLPQVASRTVLVVDNNQDVLSLFQRYLASGGYRAVIARTGAEAIALATTIAPCAITLDLMMNGEDGWDVMEALRQHPTTAALPIIVCSVLDHEHLALMSGAQAFLKKPVLRESLLTLLSAILENR